jgi:hypothetical protein
MNATPIPAFSSPDLQKALEDVRPALEGADKARNRLSEDIKALEGYLQKLDVKTDYWFGLGKAFVGEEGDQHLAAAMEYSGCASGVINEEFLAWVSDKRGKRRLMYEVRAWQGNIDIDMHGGPLFWDSSTETTEVSIPLIEPSSTCGRRCTPSSRISCEHLVTT